METTNLYKDGLPDVIPTKLWTAQKEIKEHSVLEVCNQQFECDEKGFPTEQAWINLSKILNIYSDNRFETFRYLIVKNDIILEHISVSSQIPTYSLTSPSNLMLDKLHTYLQETDTKILTAHNHPSGYIGPSQDDIDITSFLSEQFTDDDKYSRFLGNVIIGYNNDLGIYSEKDKTWNCVSNEKIISIDDFPYNPQDNGLPIIRGSLGILQLADFAYQIIQNVTWDANDKISAFYINRNQQVTGIQYFNTEDFFTSQIQNIPDTLKTSAKITGSESVIFVLLQNDKNLFNQIEYFAEQTHMINNIYHPTEDGYETIKDSLEGDTIFNINEETDLVIMDSREIKQK